jgi:hypothetical protein
VLRYTALAPVLEDIELEQQIALVVADNKLSPYFVMRRRPERLDSIHAAAITRKPDHRFVRVRQLHIAPGIPTPRDPPCVWKKCPGTVGGRYRASSGETVSDSSKIITSLGSCSASSGGGMMGKTVQTGQIRHQEGVSFRLII